MARIRTIKPELFRNHELYQRELAANSDRGGHEYLNIRFAFAGLFTAADREGRFKWRPHELKLDCLPFDLSDFSEIMAVLAAAPKPFIAKYTVDGQDYGIIPGFLKHQRPKHDEAQSVLPKPPDGFDPNSTDTVRQPDADRTPIDVRKGKERKWKGNDLTAQTTGAVKEPHPLQRVIRSYKVAKGMKADDQEWDKAQFKVHARAAKKLLDAFKRDDKAAVAYLLWKAQEFNEAGINWALATIAKHAWDDRGKHGIEARDDRRVSQHVELQEKPMGDAGLLERRGYTGIAQAGSLAKQVVQQLADSRSRPQDDRGHEPQEFDSPFLAGEDPGDGAEQQD
jgi:hypothetical protein